MFDLYNDLDGNHIGSQLFLPKWKLKIPHNAKADCNAYTFHSNVHDL